MKTDRALKAWGASPQAAAFVSMDSAPDKRAGTVSKTDDSLIAAGCKSSAVRHFHITRKDCRWKIPPTPCLYFTHHFEPESSILNLSCSMPCPRSSAAQSSRLLTGGSKVQLLPGMPFLQSSSSPTSRGIPLKTGELRVQFLPGGPHRERRPAKAPGPGANGIVLS